MYHNYSKISFFYKIIIILLILLSINNISSKSISNINKESNSKNLLSKNLTQEGSITICSDNLSYSQNENTMIYSGNVFIFQIKDLKISCNFIFKNNNKKFKNYQIIQNQALRKAKKICYEKKGCKFISGKNLIIIFSKNNKKINDIIVSTPKPYVVKFYSLPFNKKTTKSNIIYAEGRKMKFKLKENILIIENQAYIDWNNKTFSGKKILYDTKNEIISSPFINSKSIVVLKHSEK